LRLHITATAIRGHHGVNNRIVLPLMPARWR